jgi:hypothetical protein
MKILEKLKTDRQDLIAKLCDNIDALERIALEQQAEIERLEGILNKRCDVCPTREAVERYKHSIKLLEKDVTVAREDAVKEFAKFVIDKSVNGVVYASDIVDYVPEFLGR